MYYSEKYTFYKIIELYIIFVASNERCFLNGGYMKQIQYLNYFIRYKAMKLLNAMNFPTEIEFFDILNWKT